MKPRETRPESKPLTPLTPERWREVDAVVRGALAQPPHARAAFVASACSGDATLRREVEELLAVHTGDFLARPAAATFAAAEDSAMYAGVSAALAGRYELERELGRGGMATVYLARDLRHDRPVAVKVLHAELAAVVGGARFLTEIRTTAALQHPHILPLFDSGSAENDGLLYYVMPFVAGETLRGRLTRERQLPVADALRVATEVASALEYAHRHGVIHRDIKPENILLGEDGQALVADFGIALAISHAAGERLTQSGLSLGTPQYMAPEQAAGERSRDARVDVYALGAVTYEMLAGEPPFTGPTAQAILARVMTELPRALSVQRPTVPQHVDAAVRTALEKVPADRFPSASAFSAALAAAPSPEFARPLSPATPRRRSAPIIAALASTALLAAALGWGAARWGSAHESSSARAATAENKVVRFVIGLDSAIFLDYFSDPAISPDGRTIVYAADGPDGTRLYARPIDQLSSQSVAGTEDAKQPFFSPDGQWVGFLSHGMLRKTRLEGGTPLPVTTVPSSTTGAHLEDFISSCGWGTDDIITCAATDLQSPLLFRVPAAGGQTSAVRLVDSTTVFVGNPHPLPGRKAVLVTVVRASETSQPWVGVLDPVTGGLRQFGAGEGARYVSGAIVYVKDGELLRQSFDIDLMEPTGTPEPITKDIETFYTGRSGFDVSQTGAIVYCPSTSRKNREALIVTDRSGRTEQVIAAHMAWVPRFSPDGGHRVAYGAIAPLQHNGDVWISDLTAGTKERITTDDRDGNDPVWRPDAKAIAYSAYRSGGTTKRLVVRTLADGTERSLGEMPGSQLPSDWTPDGRFVFFTENRDSIGRAGQRLKVQEIWVAPVNGSPARPYLRGRAHEFGARVSPDGHWVAYVSDETGRNEVYLQSYPTPGHEVLVSGGGGDNPMWRHDGWELYYWQADQLLAVTFDPHGISEPPRVRGRTTLFHAPYIENLHSNYDVSSDGTRFVFVPGNTRANRLAVALNLLGQDRPPAR